MKGPFVYFPKTGDPYVFQDWLRRCSKTSTLCLLSDHPEAAQLAAPHGNVARVVSVHPGAPLPLSLHEAVQEDDNKEVFVAMALQRVPMRYHAGALRSDLCPHYELLHCLWCWGFRVIRFVSQQHEERIALPYVLDAFHQRHRGQRCFVVGNGPSLQDIDMTLLKDEITLGSNRCFLGYETWGFPFTYWGVYDKYQIETYHDVYEQQVPADTVKFFPVEYAPMLHVARGCPVNSVWPRKSARAFSAVPDHTFVGFTVTYMLLQIAACMGCNPIILIGTDHRYGLKERGYNRWARRLRRRITRRLRGGRVYETLRAGQRAWLQASPRNLPAPTLWTTENARNPTHFTAAYTDGGKNRFLPPEPEEAERDFDEAQRWAVQNHVEILNATPNSALKSFPLVDFETLF